jgi:hypothetical protein
MITRHSNFHNFNARRGGEEEQRMESSKAALWKPLLHTFLLIIIHKSYRHRRIKSSSDEAS